MESPNLVDDVPECRLWSLFPGQRHPHPKKGETFQVRKVPTDTSKVDSETRTTKCRRNITLEPRGEIKKTSSAATPSTVNPCVKTVGFLRETVFLGSPFCRTHPFERDINIEVTKTFPLLVRQQSHGKPPSASVNQLHFHVSVRRGLHLLPKCVCVCARLFLFEKYPRFVAFKGNQTGKTPFAATGSTSTRRAESAISPRRAFRVHAQARGLPEARLLARPRGGFAAKGSAAKRSALSGGVEPWMIFSLNQGTQLIFFSLKEQPANGIDPPSSTYPYLLLSKSGLALSRGLDDLFP